MWILRRLSEGSTWAGLGLMAGALIPAFPAAAVALKTAVGIAAGMAVVLKDKAQPAPPAP